MTAEQLDVGQKMTAFARTFPSLTKAAGVTLWDAPTLDRWSAETPVSAGELATARFVLTVWDPARDWQCGRFDVMDALRAWDGRHRAAFVAWAADPWWP